MKKINTFSANSLKLLKENKEEFTNRYLYSLSLRKREERAALGQKFHSLIYFYIKNYSIEKLILSLNEEERRTWKNLVNYLNNIKNNFIKTEYPFLVKEYINTTPYYLTGRFDAIYKEGDNYIIYDWKTLNIPQNAQEDLQSLVYLFAANKIYNTNKIKIRYLSIEKLDYLDVEFKDSQFYKEKIDRIILKHWEI